MKIYCIALLTTFPESPPTHPPPGWGEWPALSNGMNGVPLFYHQGTTRSSGFRETHDPVKQIFKHRVKNGKMQFLTRWKGASPEKILGRMLIVSLVDCLKHGLNICSTMVFSLNCIGWYTSVMLDRLVTLCFEICAIVHVVAPLFLQDQIGCQFIFFWVIACTVCASNAPASLQLWHPHGLCWTSACLCPIPSSRHTFGQQPLWYRPQY